MSKKIDRAAHGPSWTEIILGVVLSLVLGVVLGAVLLVMRPVVVAKEAPKDPDPKAVYFIEGSRDTAKARQALAKRKAFVEGQSVTVTEDEINALAAPTPTPAPGAKAGEKKADPKAKTDPKAKEAEKAAPAAAAADGAFAVGQPNFRVREGKVHIGVPVTINVLGLGEKVMAQASGGIVKKGDLFVFDPDTLYIGSCPVQRLPMVAGYVRNAFIAAQPIPEDIKTSWMKLANVSIEGNAVKLTMP